MTMWNAHHLYHPPCTIISTEIITTNIIITNKWIAVWYIKNEDPQKYPPKKSSAHSSIQKKTKTKKLSKILFKRNSNFSKRKWWSSMAGTHTGTFLMRCCLRGHFRPHEHSWWGAVSLSGDISGHTNILDEVLSQGTFPATQTFLMRCCLREHFRPHEHCSWGAVSEDISGQCQTDSLKKKKNYQRVHQCTYVPLSTFCRMPW